MSVFSLLSGIKADMDPASVGLTIAKPSRWLSWAYRGTNPTLKL
jgi:hypothetical protein